MVRATREARGISQADLAKASGLSQAHISQIERGPANPTFHTVLKLADGLGVRPSDLMPEGGHE